MGYLKSARCFLVALVVLSFSITGCQDGNLFGRLSDRGDSSSIASLLSDAESALRERNFSQALDLYNRILAVDSDNGAALYGAAAAQLGASGFNIAQIVVNILENENGAGSSSMGLSELVRSASNGGAASSSDPSSLLYGIDIVNLNANIGEILCKLQKIVSGNSDGSVSRDSVDLLVNFAVLRVIRAAAYANDIGLVDFQNVNGTWSVAPGASYSTICGDSQYNDEIETIGLDLAAAYASLNRVISLLNLSGNQVIVNLQADVDEVITEFLTTGLPAQCLTTLSNVNITAATFRTRYDLSTPPSGC